jgi:hypothetical protein
MKKTLLFAIAMSLGVSATALAANPFSDLPQGHWAYSSVAELVSEGVVTGYPDGTFKGDTTMTRYEMAQIVAKALAKGAINENDALVAEFADELDNLGVRVTKLEKKSDNVKLTGSLRYRYFSHSSDVTDESELRTRIGVAGSINDDWTYNALIENDKNFGHDIASDDDETEFRRAWLSGSLGEVGVTAGRFNYTVLDGNVFDDEIDGAKFDFNVLNTDLALTYGRQDSYDEDTEEGNDENLLIMTGETQIGAIEAKGSYFNLLRGEGKSRHQIVSIGLAGEVMPDLTLSGTYLYNNMTSTSGDKDGYVFGVNYKGANKNIVGSYGVYAKYNNQSYYTYIAHTTDANTFDKADGGFKGTTLGVDYTVAKNIVATINYFDTKALYGNNDDQTVMSQLYMFF